MSCTLTEELVPGHCLIVPIQHHLSTLELEDDDWEEIRVSLSFDLSGPGWEGWQGVGCMQLGSRKESVEREAVGPVETILAEGTKLMK
jgi:hypothetical protein